MAIDLLVHALGTILVVILAIVLIDRLPVDARTRTVVRIVAVALGALSLLRLLGVFAI